MPTSNSWLCQYAISQIGRPYWYKTSGQIATTDLYGNVVRPALLNDYGLAALYTNIESQLNQKVHDCSGLIIGALTCTNVNTGPTQATKVSHSADYQFKFDCTNKSNKMSDFPYIPGTLVFTTSGDVKNHVGIYIGTYIDTKGTKHTDIVVDAKGNKYGVVTSVITDKQWDSWGQLNVCKVDTKKGQIFTLITDAIASDNTEIVSPMQIETQNMTPFVATVAYNYSGSIDYDKIKEARISAMMFFAGELYTPSHTEKTYVNPHLANLVQDCNNAGMSYALYVNIRARTDIEADKECRTLYYVISQYLPKLGLWLAMPTTNTIEQNDRILEIYYKYLQKWGLGARCGLYLTKDQLSKITWNSFKDRFYLWLIDPMDISKVDDELLDPEMFEVPD